MNKDKKTDLSLIDPQSIVYLYMLILVLLRLKSVGSYQTKKYEWNLHKMLLEGC